MNDRHWWSFVISTITAASALLMRMPMVLQILFVLMFLDLILTRFVASSWQELMKRFTRMVATCVLLAALGKSEPVLGFAAMEYTAVFFIVNELIAITEKAAQLGVPIPERVRRVLTALREERNDQPDRAKAESNTDNSR